MLGEDIFRDSVCGHAMFRGHLELCTVCLMAALESPEMVTVVPVTYTSLFAAATVTIFSTITPVAGGYLEKAHFGFTLSFAASLSSDSGRSPWAFGQSTI